MKKYDVAVIGSGAGMNVASNALQQGKTVALFEHGLMGGTCLNTGCIPSKILLYPADVVKEMKEAERVGVKTKVEKIDFKHIMERMRQLIVPDRNNMARSVEKAKNITWYKETAQFIDDYTLQSGSKKVKADKIIIASGSRPFLPNIPGLKEVGYLDNRSVLDIEEAPESILILGGGFVGCEYAHFFSSMGTETTLIGRNSRLIKEEDMEISTTFRTTFSKFVKTYTGFTAVKVEKTEDGKKVIARNEKNGKNYQFKAQEIMLATGRRSNNDLLKFENTGVETDEGGWVKVNKYLETSKENIWALGDALGKYMFRHTANHEARIVWMNAFTQHKQEMDYSAIPHAVFSHPQVSGVGLTETEVKARGVEYLVGRTAYGGTAKGYAMGTENTLFKVLVEKKNKKILGAHAVGPWSSDLIQQVTYLMNAGGGDFYPIYRAEVTHPALSEVVVNAFGSLVPPEHSHRHGHDHSHKHDEEEHDH